MYIHVRIHGHTGGNIMSLELMAHVAIPYSWKEFVFHRGCSFKIKSILETELTAGGRESKEGRQTIFFTPLNLSEESSEEEEPRDTLSVPRKLHCHRNLETRPRCCLLGKMVSSTRSRIAILANEIKCHTRTRSCVGRLHPQVISQNGGRTLFERLFTPRPAPRITLKSRLHTQQQHLQQQQQQRSESASSCVWKHMRSRPRCKIRKERSRLKQQTISVQLTSGNR